MIGALASDLPKVSAEKMVTASRGETVEIDINLENDRIYNGLVFNVEYDEDAFEFQSSDHVDLTNTDAITTVTDGNGSVSYAFATAAEDKSNYSGRLWQSLKKR